MKNAVILNKDASTWPRIKKYWEERGVTIPSYLTESACTTTFVLGTSNSPYLGLIHDTFAAWALYEVKAANAEIIELPEEKDNYLKMLEEKYIPKDENNHPEKPILRKAYEIIGRLKAENLKRAGFNDIEISSYLDADKDLKEIESHLNK